MIKLKGPRNRGSHPYGLPLAGSGLYLSCAYPSLECYNFRGLSSFSSSHKLADAVAPQGIMSSGWTVVNAVYHRGYDVREPVEIRIMHDELVVLSYPGPDRSVRLEQLRVGKAMPRRYRGASASS